MSAMRHFLDVDELTKEEILDVLDLAESTKVSPPSALAGKGVALLFEKPSARTRNATEVAVFELGGHPVTMRGEEVDMDGRESVEDVTLALASYHAIICARVYDHHTLVRMAKVSPVPIVNLLSDVSHPCQALADLMTIRELKGNLQDTALAYVGDYNNVARSLAKAAVLAGLNMRIASPPGYGPSDSEVEVFGNRIVFTESPVDATKDADVIYTDTWTSMGRENETVARRMAFQDFTVDEALMQQAAPSATFLHCLPAHRGEEVSASVIDGPKSAVWRQAANRMHAARGLLAWLSTKAAA